MQNIFSNPPPPNSPHQTIKNCGRTLQWRSKSTRLPQSFTRLKALDLEIALREHSSKVFHWRKL